MRKNGLNRKSEKIDIDRSIFTVTFFWMYVHEEHWILDDQKRRCAICYSLCIYLKYIVHALYTCIYMLHLTRSRSLLVLEVNSRMILPSSPHSCRPFNLIPTAS